MRRVALLQGQAVSGEHVLRVVRGRPSEEELAALTALMSTIEPDESPPVSLAPHGRWADPAWAFQRPLHPGPGAWRAAAWPG